MTSRIPPAMWVAIVALGFITLMTLFLAVAKGSLLNLITAGLNAALLLGLADGRKWAYVLTIVFSVLGAGFAFYHSGHQGMGVLLVNGLVAVPVLISTSFFFPPDQREPFQQ